MRREQNDERISTFQRPDDQLGRQPDGQPARQLASQARYDAAHFNSLGKPQCETDGSREPSVPLKVGLRFMLPAHVMLIKELASTHKSWESMLDVSDTCNTLSRLKGLHTKQRIRMPLGCSVAVCCSNAMLLPTKCSVASQVSVG